MLGLTRLLVAKIKMWFLIVMMKQVLSDRQSQKSVYDKQFCMQQQIK